MTEEERKLALYCLKANSDYHSEVCEECVNYSYCDHTMQDDLTETIIKALEQQPCDDAIRRRAVLNILTEQERLARDRVIDTPSSLGNGLHTCVNPAYTRYSAQLSERKQFKAMIQSMTSVTPQPKMGRWIYKGYYECSECGKSTYIDKSNYCPNCGAKMEANKSWKQEH